MPTIRLALARDAPGIAAVHVRCWQSAYAGQLPADFLRELSVSNCRRNWERALGGGAEPTAGRTLVVEVDGIIGGFANVGPCRGDGAPEWDAELRAIYLEPRHWSRGIGRLLHDEAMDTLRDAGCRHAMLWVLSTNVRARRFYERAGWSPDGAAKVDQIRGVTLDEVRYVTIL
jgi:GNAT superfamily N-acetyltransferase